MTTNRVPPADSLLRDPPAPDTTGQRAAQVPPGFVRHTRRSGLTEPWEPLYARHDGDHLHLGLVAGPAHANSRGFVHGGLIGALADNAMGLCCKLARGEHLGSLVTVNLSVDFVATARQGQWLEFRPTVVKVGGTMAFATALVFADDAVCARANATFKAAGR